MSKRTKTVLIIIGVALVLCCIGGVAVYLIIQQLVGQAFTTDSAQAARIGHEIADYTPPSGYHEMLAMNMAGIKMVLIGPESQSTNAMVLMLMQFPAESNMSQAEMEQQMRQALAQQGQQSNAQMQVVGTQKATIKGQSVTLTVSEGQSQDGKTMRQVVGVFPGNNGLVMVMAMGAKDSWNEALLTRFLASIK